MLVRQIVSKELKHTDTHTHTRAHARTHTKERRQGAMVSLKFKKMKIAHVKLVHMEVNLIVQRANHKSLCCYAPKRVAADALVQTHTHTLTHAHRIAFCRY